MMVSRMEFRRRVAAPATATGVWGIGGGEARPPWLRKTAGWDDFVLYLICITYHSNNLDLMICGRSVHNADDRRGV